MKVEVIERRIQEVADCLVYAGMFRPPQLDVARAVATKTLRYLHWKAHFHRPHLPRSQCQQTVTRTIDLLSVRELLQLVDAVNAMAFIPLIDHELTLEN